MTNLSKVTPMDLFIGYIKKKSWYIDINTANTLKKHFATEAA